MVDPTPAPVYLGLGGNLGAVRATLAAARLALRSLSSRPVRCSPLVQSAPWGGISQPEFINQVVGIWPRTDRAALFAALLRIEALHGRDRATEIPWGPRPLDIDVLTWPGVIDPDPRLTLPHPRLHTRRFVLLPWSLIAPDYVVPGLGRSVADLLAGCSDSGVVSPLD